MTGERRSPRRDHERACPPGFALTDPTFFLMWWGAKLDKDDRRERAFIGAVPLPQDNPAVKPNSLASDLSYLADAVVAALEGKQLQPLLIER